jgi:hypothetical protein
MGKVEMQRKAPVINNGIRESISRHPENQVLQVMFGWNIVVADTWSSNNARQGGSVLLAGSAR